MRNLLESIDNNNGFAPPGTPIHPISKASRWGDESSSEENKCPRCGAEFDPDSLEPFCDECGFDLDKIDEDNSNPTVYSADDGSAEYTIHIQDDGVFVEVDGIAIASSRIGGAGSMSPVIKDPGELMNALIAFAQRSR